MSLSAGGLILGGGSKRKAGRMTHIMRQIENICVKKWRKCIVLFVYFLMKENLYLSGSKIGISTFTWEGLCAWGSVVVGAIMIDGAILIICVSNFRNRRD